MMQSYLPGRRIHRDDFIELPWAARVMIDLMPVYLEGKFNVFEKCFHH